MIPLLPQGLHPMRVDDLRLLCVDDFSGSSTRRYLADAFEELIESLAECELRCEIWVDGSYLTSKLNPADLDVVFVFNVEAIPAADDEATALIQRIGSNLRDETGCDTYAAFKFPDGHPLHDEGLLNLQHWLSVFGYDRDGGPKGIAVLSVG